LSFSTIATYLILLEPAPCDYSTGIEDAEIAPKPKELPPNMKMGEERLGGALVFEF
jgi:hypothetical protein